MARHVTFTMCQLSINHATLRCYQASAFRMISARGDWRLQAFKVTWLVRADKVENAGQEKVFEPMLKEKLPNIQFERVIVPGVEYIPKISTMAAANESLEIWGFGGNYYDYWYRGLPQELSSYIKADNWDVDNYFLPGLMDKYKIHGKNWGLSQLTCFGSIMAYNKDMFAAAGIPNPPSSWDDTSWTMDKMVEIATKLTKNYGKPDATYGVDFRLWPQPASYAYLWGGDAFLPEHYTNFIAPKTNFNTQENIDAHQFRADLIYKQKVHPDPATAQGLNQVADPFTTGRLGMALDGGWVFWSYAPITDFKVGYAPIPMAKTNKNVTFNDFWIMGKWATNKDAAWQVMRLLTSPGATSAYSVSSGTPPTVRESLPAWIDSRVKFTGMTTEQLNQVTVGGIEKGRAAESIDHIFLQEPKIEDTYDQAIDPLWKGKGDAKTVIADVTKKLDDVCKAIYDQFNGKMPPD